MMLFIVIIPLSLKSQDDIYEDASAYGYDLKQEQEDEVFFYESRFVDIGIHGGGRSFTGGLGHLFGLGPSFGLYFDYFFSRRFAMEITVNDSFHRFNIDGESGWATLLDILVRGKFYFVSDGYSKALSFLNPYIFLGGGEFIRTKFSSSVPGSATDQGPGFDFGGGFEIPLKQRLVYMGVQSSYQLIFFQDEDKATSRGTKRDGDAIQFCTTLTYSF